MVADIADIARGAAGAPFGRRTGELEPLHRAPMGRHEGGYYVRLQVADRPGAAAAIATRMAEEQISLESILQKGGRPAPGTAPAAAVPVVLITYATTEGAIRSAIERILSGGHIVEPPQVIRIERD